MKKLRVGILPQGGKEWIAGVIYLQNLIRACALLPEEERPEFYILDYPGSETAALRELGELLPPAHQYNYRESFTKYYKLRATLKCLAHGRLPVSFESLASKLKLSAIFPVQGPVGEGFPVPSIGWIPDFQHNRMPHFFSKEEYADRDRRFSRLINECSHLVVSSQDAHNDLMRWFSTDPKRISILRYYNMPVDEWFKGSPQETAREFNLPAKYLMFPSQFWIHKNHKNLLRALALVKKQGLANLAVVFTGFQNDYRQPRYFKEVEALIQELGLKDNIHMLGLLPRQKQVQLLRQAVAILQPSYFEGWSSLVEDCRSLGKKIYLSDIPIHREQNPPDAVFFNPDSVEELAEHLKRDWPHLKPGPDLDKEKQARESSCNLGQVYARDFLNIVERAMA